MLRNIARINFSADKRFFNNNLQKKLCRKDMQFKWRFFSKLRWAFLSLMFFRSFWKKGEKNFNEYVIKKDLPGLATNTANISIHKVNNITNFSTPTLQP